MKKNQKAQVQFIQKPNAYNLRLDDNNFGFHGVDAAMKVIDKVLTKGGQKIYVKYVMEKTDKFVPEYILENLQCFEQMCVQNKDVLEDNMQENDEIQQRQIDTWAVQSLRTETKLIDQTLDTSKIQTATLKSNKTFTNFKKKKVESKESIKTVQNEQKMIFQQLPEEDPEPEPTDPDELVIFKKMLRVREERMQREEQKQIETQSNNQEKKLQKQQTVQSSKQEQAKQPIKQLNYVVDYDGNLIHVKHPNHEQLPPDMAIVQYKDQEIKVEKLPYERLGVKVYQPQELKENTLINSFEGQVPVQKEKKKDKKHKAYNLEDGFELQMGVNLIKEDGQRIDGPQYAFSNRIKKSDYIKQCENESSEKSFYERSYRIFNQDLKQELNKIQEIKKIDESEDKNEQSISQQIESSAKSFLNEGKDVKIHKNAEYGKMLLTLNKNQINSRILSAKPNLEQPKVRRVDPNRIHVYHPEIINHEQNTFQNRKQSQKIENFNQKIFQNADWGHSRPVTDRNTLPQLSSNRVKSAVLSNKNRKQKLNY